MKLDKSKIDTIFQGDCVEGMRTLPEGCCSLIIADPPYNQNDKWGDRSPSVGFSG